MLDALDRADDDLFDLREPGPDPPLGNAVDGVLRFVEELLDVAGIAAHRAAHDVARHVDEPAQDSLLLDDACVEHDVRRGRRALDQFGDRRRAADCVEVSAALQALRHRDDVGRLAPLVEFDERPPDATVRLPVEVLLGQDVAGALEGLVVEQDPAEHGLLGLDALRRDPETSDNVLAHVRTSFREHARPGQRH